MAFWPFRKREAPKPPYVDRRNWNEDWRVGDTAECILGADGWHPDLPPWERPKLGQRFTVIGFHDARGCLTGKHAYFLELDGWPVALETTGFRKVRPVSAEQSEIVQRILNAKPGADRKREVA